MAGIIEQRDIGALHLAAEILHGGVHRRFVEIELGAAADQGEAEAAERIGHQRRVVAGIVEPCDVLIGGVADHQRDALFGRSGRAEQQRQQERQRCQRPNFTADSPAHPQCVPSNMAADYQPAGFAKSGHRRDLCADHMAPTVLPERARADRAARLPSGVRGVTPVRLCGSFHAPDIRARRRARGRIR